MTMESCPDKKKLVDFNLGELPWSEMDEIEKT